MSALAATTARLRELRPAYPDAYAVRIGVPAEPGWRSLAVAVPDVAEWCARARQEDNPAGLASVAATSVAGTLVHAVLGRVSAALLLERRAWDVRAGNLLVHPGTGGVAVRDATLLVLPDDPAAGDRDVEVVADTTVLLDRVAEAAVATLGPLLDAVRAATRYGLVPLWNGVADSVRSAATYVPLYAGTDRTAAAELGAALVDALVAHGARIRHRGGTEAVQRGADTYAVPVRAACCLYYKTEPQVERASDAYCMTCPFLCSPERAQRFGAFVDGLAPAAVTAGGP
ncbi:hypothetical protein [Pseudonocardia kunmingensis]|uniref:Ferric iron reductase FhuF-like transporter n=1 Tax=Pseudonocardia kunmingensis TaxID=630975 RepID=A0A543DXF1_9PSEU|nr:hypothetical protein [Pseudonocardia kunmingensis]TQM14010.1 hypothetical protein FB558_0767 [Pseudonocardia kunmingensis]